MSDKPSNARLKVLRIVGVLLIVIGSASGCAAYLAYSYQAAHNLPASAGALLLVIGVQMYAFGNVGTWWQGD